MAEQVATLLKRNVVQGVAEEDKPDVFSMLSSGAYEPKRLWPAKPLELRITPDTELGDNDSIKKAKGSHRKNKTRKCSSAS